MTRRDDPPHLFVSPPECEICNGDTRFADGSWECDHCEVSWPLTGGPGVWFRQDDEQCPSRCRLFADNPRASAVVREKVYRCLLKSGHDGLHREGYSNEWDDQHHNRVTVEVSA